MRRLQIALVTTFLLMPTLLLAQYGDEHEQGWGIHDGNLVRTTTYNYGLVGNVGSISFEWPKGTGNEYIGDFSPYLAVEYLHPCGDTIHSAITCLSPRQGPEFGNDGMFSGFMAIPGYSGSTLPIGAVELAMSDKPWSWPVSWLGWGAGYNGEWVGLYAPGETVAAQESYWQMDDNQDHEFRTLPDGDGVLHTLYPFSVDSTRYGAGVRIEGRGLQFTGPLAENAIVFMYILHNDGEIEIPDARFALMVGDLVGGRGDSEDDLVFMDDDGEIVFSADSDDQGSAGWIPVSEEVEVGTIGVSFLKTPGDLGLTSMKHFTPPGAVRMNDDEALWDYTEPGYFDNPYQDPEDGDYLMGTGGFAFEPFSSDTVIAAVMFGEDTGQIERTRSLLKSMVDQEWSLPDGNCSITSPSEGDELAGTETIEYEAPGASQVSLYVSRSYMGEGPWVPVAEDQAVSGSFAWPTLQFNDGARNWLRMIASDGEGQVTGVATVGPFVINNSVESPPELVVLTPEQEGELFTGPITVEWWAGDADGDELDINITYDPGNGHLLTIADELPNTGSFVWENHGLAANSDHARFLLSAHATIPTDSTNRASKYFRKHYDQGWLEDNLVVHETGPAETDVDVRFCWFESPQSDYRLDFSWDRTYSVTRLLNNVVVIQDEPVSSIESPLFDGKRLTMDPRPTELLQEESGWVQQGDLMNVQVDLTNYAVYRIEGIPLPYDYDICFSDENVGTSTLLQGILGFELPVEDVAFTVWNVTENRPQQFAFDHRASMADWPVSFQHTAIVMLDSLDGEQVVAWAAQFSPNLAEDHVRSPELGDTVRIRTFKGFTGWDSYAIHTSLSGVDEEPAQPTTASLTAAWPNPFNQRCSIAYQLPVSQHAEVAIFNVLGQEVARLVDGYRPAGEFRLAWDATGIASGVYFVRLKTDQRVQLKKIVLLR